MRKLKLFFACLLMAVLSIGQMWAGEVTISPSQALNGGGVSPISVACAKGTGSSNPAISSGQLRLYQAASGKTTGNTISFSSEKTITSIVFTFANNMTASNGSFSEGSYDGTDTWTGSTNSLTLTVTGTTSGKRIYITNMVVTYDDGGSSDACATPTFTPNGGDFLTSTSVELATTTEGADIYYTLDGTDPSTSSTKYTAAIPLSETTTIKAIAAKSGMDNSSIASKTFTKLTVYNSAAELQAAVTTTATNVYVAFNNWVVTFVNSGNNNAYVIDGAGKGVLLYHNSIDFVAGDRISGTVATPLVLYTGKTELTSVTASTEGLTVTAGTVSPIEVTEFNTISAANQSALVTLKNAEYNATAKTFSDGTNTIAYYDNFKVNPVLEDGKKYNVTGIVILYNANLQVAPRTAADVEEIVVKHTVTYNAAPDNGTLAIYNGENLIASGDEVNEGTVLTITTIPAEGYKLTAVTVNGEAYTASTLTLAGDVTIAASFEENLAPEITSFVLSEIGEETDVKEDGQRVGDKVNLPLTAATCSKTFMGWSENASCAVAPEYNPGAEYTLKADNKLYAVYATPGTTSYVEASLVSLTASDVFVIVGNNGATYAMANNNGTSNAPAAVAVTIAESKIFGDVAANIQWNISGNATDGYIFYPNGSTTTWLYCTNSNNGVRVGTGDAKHFTINNDYLYESETAKARYLGIYSSQDWRCYDNINSNISGQTFAFYKKVVTEPSDYSTDCPAIVLPKYTVRLWNTAEGWSAVNAHVWNTNGNVTEWPGEATDFAAGWNTFEVEEGNSLLFCKTDGSAQTVDITNVTADACYVLTGEADGAGHLEVALDTECAARFYVAGNTELTGQNWNAAGSRLEDGSITFTNVPAGDHEFKVTNGSWNWERGYLAFDSENSNVTNWGENNVGFTTTEASDITISYDEANNKIAVHVTTVEYRAIVVAYGDKYYAMTTTLENKGFTPLEVKIDGEGNVVVNSAAERNSILWKFTEGTGTATFQDADDKYLAHTGTGTDLTLQAADTENPEVWTWDNDHNCYYVAVTKDSKTTNRSFFYQASGNIFKDYGVEANLGQNGYSGAPAFYAAANVLVSTTAKLRFFAPVAWGDNVKAYTWDGGAVEYPMTAVEEGSRWFECDLTKGLEFLIYNGEWDDLNQTENIAAIDADKCLAWSGISANGKYNVAEITSCELNYYIAGDQALTGVAEWGHKALVNNALTFNEVEANIYKFKITNGSWAWNLGAAFVDADACVGVTIKDTDAEGNVVFTIDALSNITIAYNPATEKISIVASVPTPKEYYTKVTSTEDITAGTYLIVNEDEFGSVAFNGGLTTKMDDTDNVINVEIVGGNKIEVSDAVNAASFFLDPEIGTIKATNGKYIGVSSYSNGLKDDGMIYTFANAFSIDGDGNAVITIETSGGTMTMRYNAASNQNRFRYFKSGQQAIQLYKKAEAAKASPELAFNPNAVEAIKGDAFVAPTLSNEHNVTVAYEAGNGKATVVAETGEVTLVSAGDVTIYAVSAANDEYRESYAKYTIHISEYTTVRTELEMDRYYTVCLEKNITKAKGASFWNLTYKNAEAATLVFLVEADELEAGKPYIFQAEADKLEVVYGAETANAPVENGALRGTFEDIDAAAFATVGVNPYLLINNALCPRTTGNYLSAHRAYIEFDALTVAPAQGFAPGKRVRSIQMQPNTATGIDALNATDKPVKVVIDGKMLILRGEKMYDATGRLVK